MLVLIAAWAVLMLVSAQIGAAVICQPVTAMWVGVVVWASMLLLLSLNLPITWPVALGVGVALWAIASRFRLERALMIWPRGWQWAAIGVAMVIGAIVAQGKTLYDTGLYHHQLIRWLASYGSVPGLALVHERFGFTSAWFALAAPLSTPLGHTTSVLGGFAFVLTLLQWSTCLTRIWQHRSHRADWFLAIATTALLPYVLTTRMVASSSPNLVIVLLAIHSIFLYLQHAETGDRQPLIALLVLAAGAMAIKLTALPLVLAAVVLALRRRVAGWAIGAVLTLALPAQLVTLQTTGCPLYPSSVGCLALPWSLSHAGAAEMSQLIRTWAYWNLGQAPAGATLWDGLVAWVRATPIAASLALYSALCVVLSRSWLGWRFVVSVAGVGLLMFFYSGPDPRYGMGYLLILPCFWAASWLCKLPPRPVVMGLLASCAIAVSISYGQSAARPQTLRLAWPAPLPTIEVQTYAINNVSLFKPVGKNQCWTAPLPCTPELNDAIRLRGTGLHQGFAQATNASLSD